MKRAFALLVMLCAAVSPAAQTAAAPAFQPEQLRDFDRDTLVVQRATGRDQFTIWMADTPAQQQQGLMWIQQLPADYGMLFLLPQPRPMSMWMKNTYVSLDMVFFDASGRILRIHEHAAPLSEAIIYSGVEVAGVLEILAGEARRRGMQVGDRLLHPRLGR